MVRIEIQTWNSAWLGWKKTWLEFWPVWGNLLRDKPQCEAQLFPLPPPSPAATVSAPRAKAAVVAPPGLDPHIVQQALVAGVSQQALQELGNVIARTGVPRLPERVPAEVMGISDDDEGDELLGDGSGLQDPLQGAVVNLSSIVSEMRPKKRVKKDKTLEAIFSIAPMVGL